MATFSTILILAGLVGLGYVGWRIVRRGRGRGNPDGHPRLRVAGVATMACLLVGGILAPVEESTEADTAQTEAQGADAKSAAREREARAAQREREEAAAREQAERERAEAKRRRRATQGETGRVTRVIDGDTVEMEGVGRVRLIGVDTPERGEECFEEATDYLKDRVGGQTVRYRPQREREDRYDRALLDLFRGGQLINLDIAQAGWGEALTIQPNDRYADRIVEAEVEARAEPRGRWAGCLEEPEPEPEPTPEPTPEDDDDSTGGGGGVPSGTCDEIGVTDFPVPPGDPRDRDGDGIACES
jgi:micrococcal nuclease